MVQSEAVDAGWEMNTPDLQALIERSDYDGNTGIYVRAVCEGKWGSHDIAELSGDSLLNWLRADGGCNALAENTLLTLFGHEQVARQPAPTLPGAGGGDALDAARLNFLRNGGWEVMQDPKYWPKHLKFDGAIDAAMAEVSAESDGVKK